MLTHPAYAGAHVFGMSRTQRYADANGTVRTRLRRLPQKEWKVLVEHHHEGCIDWGTSTADQERIGANIRSRSHEPCTAAERVAGLIMGSPAGSSAWPHRSRGPCSAGACISAHG